MVGKTFRSRHSWRMCNPQFYVSGKRPIVPTTGKLLSHFPDNALWFSGFLGSLKKPELPSVFWFGLSLNRLDGTWYWSSNNRAASWHDWSSNEPGPAYENSGCLVFSVFRWNSCYGSNRKAYMCEIWQYCFNIANVNNARRRLLKETL